MRRLKSLVQRVIRSFLMTGHTFFLYRSYERVFLEPLLAWEPDIVHSHDGVTLPTAAKAAKRLGAKLIFDSHELEVHRSPPLSRTRKMQVRRMEKKYLPQADRVITVTELAADYLSHEYGIARPTVLFNAPPAGTYPVPDKWNVFDRPDVRADIGLPKNHFLLVYTGNITRNRGLELAILALSRVQDFKDPNERFSSQVHLAAVGKVQGSTDVVVQRLAKAYGLEGRVHLLPPVAAHNVAKYVSTADASIIPIMPVTLSYEMAMPNKLFEATLSGNPIISSDLVEMGAFVENHELGLTYRADDVDHCAERILEMITRYSEFERDAKRQRELENAWAWEAQERKLFELYENL